MLRTPGWARTWTVLRLAMAVLLLVTIAWQATTTVSAAVANGWDMTTVLTNFFSYFTILSNLLAAVALAWAAGWAWARGRRAASEPAGLALALACATTFMIVTGAVYNALLRGLPLPGDPWTNEVLHVVGPLFLLLDLFLAPRRRRLGWSTLVVIAALPVVWAVYTLVRGPLISAPATGSPPWYPYPFLNPANFANGYGGVAVYIAIIAVVIVAVGAGVVAVGRRRGAAASVVTAPAS